MDQTVVISACATAGVLWLALAFLIGGLAANRNRSRTSWVWLAILFSPLLMAIVLYSLPAVHVEVNKDSTSGAFGIIQGKEVVRCPFCAEYINPLATVCRYCSRDVASEIAHLKASDEQNREERERLLRLANSTAQELALAQRKATRTKLIAFLQSRIGRRWMAIAISAILVGGIVAAGTITYVNGGQEPARITAAEYVVDQDCGVATLHFDTTFDQQFAHEHGEFPTATPQGAVERVEVHLAGFGSGWTFRKTGQSTLTLSKASQLNLGLCKFVKSHTSEEQIPVRVIRTAATGQAFRTDVALEINRMQKD